jgi:ribonuclease-3
MTVNNNHSALIISIQSLENHIIYTFKDQLLIQDALTHPSATKSTSSKFEMLEFLGDKVLAIYVAEYLYSQCLNEKEYSTRFTSITNKHATYNAACKMNLPQYVAWKGEARHQYTIISDAFEAVVGAIYLDGGIIAAKQILSQFLSSSTNIIDPKNIVQEWAHKHGHTFAYNQISAQGKPHDMTYVVELIINNAQYKGTGKSIKDAQKNAALDFISRNAIIAS